jgi:hypothetical protein
MARWISANLGSSPAAGILPRSIVQALHTPQVATRDDPSAPSAEAHYALGWFVDAFCGVRRVSHGGYLNDVNSNVMLLPDLGIGAIAYSTFGPVKMAVAINEAALGALIGTRPSLSYEERLSTYERKVAENRERLAAVAWAPRSLSKRDAAAFAGTYSHPAYGRMEVRPSVEGLQLERDEMRITTRRTGDDLFAFNDCGGFEIHAPHAFDTSSTLAFHRGQGRVSALSIPLEPTVEPIIFNRLEDADCRSKRRHLQRPR